MIREESVSEDNFRSTNELTKNPGFQSSFSISSKNENEKAYNPFEHRTVEHPNSTIGSIMHILKACIGTGILAMPSAFKNSGLLVGSLGTLFAGYLCTHTVQMLVKTSQELCIETKKPSMTFSETCGAAFSTGPARLRPWGPALKTFTDYVMAVTYFSVCTVYVVFIASSIKEVLDVYIPQYTLSIQMYCLLQIIPLVLLCQIRNLKYLVPFVTFANALLIAIFGITLYYVFVDLPPISERELVVSPKQWPKFLSIVVFAMEGIGVVMPVENEMAHPEKFLGCPGVWNTAMTIVVSLFGAVGFFGYVQFGDESKGSITLNLPQDQILAQSTKLLMALVIYFSFALQLYVPTEIVTRLLKEKGFVKYENLTQVCMRTIMVTISVILAVSFPNLEFVIGIAGAIFFSSLGFLFPAVVHTVYCWDRGFGKFNYILWKNSFIIILSLVILVAGTYISVVEMIEITNEAEQIVSNITMV